MNALVYFVLTLYFAALAVWATEEELKEEIRHSLETSLGSKDESGERQGMRLRSSDGSSCWAWECGCRGAYVVSYM